MMKSNIPTYLMPLKSQITGNLTQTYTPTTPLKSQITVNQCKSFQSQLLCNIYTLGTVHLAIVVFVCVSLIVSVAAHSNWLL